MATTFRVNYDDQLAELRSRVLHMGNLSLDMVRLAGEAMSTGNTDLANQVVAMDDQVDRLEDETVFMAMNLVMREAPVATDLKRLLATVGIVGEIEKVADDAVKLARRASKLTGVFPAELKVMLNELSELARHAFGGSLRLYADYSDEEAKSIVDFDETVDKKYQEVRERVQGLIQANPTLTPVYLRTIEAFHALEHVADHAVEIATRLRLHFGSAPA
ncbi:MAG TPA: PhoU domain-containing protein [Fimbriimonadaceae bacterium]|nr:PhoU domain-containing protein [Fimbriimonadaceae bacterium]